MTAELPQPQPTDAVIVGGARTPFTRLLSQQADLRAVDLGAHAITHALERAGVPHDVREYPPARHAFISRNVVPSPLTTIGKVLRVGYDHDSAADAKRRILAFFDEHLRVAVTPG